nr:unnamed protein product [Digitaria exilis]
MDAAKSLTPGAVSHILANPSPGDAAEVPELVVQVVDLKSIGGTGSRFSFMASDGKDKIKAMLPTQFAAEVRSGNLQNLGLIRVLDYTCNAVPNNDNEVKKEEEPAIVLKPKDEGVVVSKPANAPPVVLKPKQDLKSASQIVNEQRGNAAPAARLSMTRRVHPLISLNPYQGNWIIKVRVTSKGNLRTYKNARGEGCVFNVELTDEDGTQIQATMFNEAAKKFYPVFELGKVYYVSKGSLRIANKQFKTVHNDYEMTLNENAVVEEAEGETFIPQVQYNFVNIDQLGPYVNGRELVECITHTEC